MRESTREHYEERILRVQLYVEKRLDQPLRLETLAEVAGFSPYHFHRIFRGMVGESLLEYVRRLRLERAACDLLATSRPVTEVAFDAGYDAHESFTRAFRALFGRSPSQYRESRADLGAVPSSAPREGPWLATPSERREPVNVEIKNLPVRRVAFVRHVGPYAECGTAWEKLCSYPGVMRYFGPQTQMLGICYDNPDVTGADKIRYDACMVVDEAFEPGGGVEAQELEGGDYAVFLHAGPYEEFHDSYRRLYGEWLPASGRELRPAPSLEVYLNNPQDTAPADLRTEICVPLR